MNEDDLEILVLATTLRDADLTVKILVSAGYRARRVGQGEIEAELTRAGLLVLSEEGLAPTLLMRLRACVLAQPRWSDIPIIVVTSGGSSTTQSNERLELVARNLQNVTLLERPIRLATFLTVVRTALSSRRKQFELKSILEDLERSRRAAEDANRAKSMFLANMSHEIRTPLTAIVGFAGLLKNPQLKQEDRGRYVDVIARNGDQLASLINDVLDLSKVEAGKVDVELREVALRQFAGEMGGLLRTMVEEKGLEFVLDVTDDLPDFVMADNTRIRQVIVNLVSNAVKFTNVGTVELGVKIHEDRLRFTVTDSGIGIAPEAHDKIFSAFTQADSTMTRRYGGTGLGLALSRALARAMGGDLVLARSQAGVGSRFELSLPFEAVTHAPVDEMPAVDKDALLGRRILLAEDSPDVVYLVNRYLGEAGAVVTNARDGARAIECALAEEFDVILMDIQMPVIDGLSATAQLRQRRYVGKIIALTAHALREERDRSLAAGCDDHLTKPIDKNILIRKIATHLN